MVSYSSQTQNNPNPIARFAHRNRYAHSIELVTADGEVRTLLDYGCGSGTFIRAVNGINNIRAFGYEPFMKESEADDLPLYRNLNDLKCQGPFDLITIFETVEHLTEKEIYAFLGEARQLLAPNGKVLFSAPIEIGPALLMKELNRSVLHKRWPEYGLIELFLAAFFGVAAKRAENIKSSHKGFDFRKVIPFLEKEFGPVQIESYGPLPTGTWYGNSQVYFWLSKR